MTPATAIYRAARRVRALAGRSDFSVFAELVLRDEESGQPIMLAPHHHEWIRLIEENPKLVLLAHIESGKSALISVGYTLWRLGRDSSLRVAILSRTHSQAVKLGRSIGTYIEKSTELHQVFPRMLPSEPWNEVQRTIVRSTVAKDPSVALYGVDGPVTGSRIDELICDDIADLLNSASAGQREKLAHMFHSEFHGRLTARGRLIAVGTPYHRDDLLHSLAKTGVPTFRYGVIDETTGLPRWESRWPMWRIEKTRKGMPAREAARQLDVRLTSDDAQVFHDQWIIHAIERGSQHTTMTRTPRGWGLVNRPRGVKIMLGVDPAASTKVSADLCALSAVAQHPDGSFELLAIESGRWGTPAAIERILDMYRRFAPDGVCIETNGMQLGWAQWLGLAGANVVEHVTSRASREARLGELEVQLSNGKWMFPAVDGRIRDAETATFAQELLDYTRTDHAPDRVVAVMIGAWAVSQATQRRIEYGWLNLSAR